MSEAAEQSIEEVEIPVAQPEPEAAGVPETGDTDPAPAPKPIVVDEVDRLKAENVNLKLLTLVNRETVLQHQINDAQRQLTESQRQRIELNEELTTMRRQLEEKYGINLTTHHIRPDDGIVIPRPVQGPIKQG